MDSANFSPLGLLVPWCMRTERSGTKCSASLRQFSMTEVGHISRTGSFSPLSIFVFSSARAWTVFPSPMSSARHPPRPISASQESQESPLSWYGLSSPQNPSGWLICSICSVPVRTDRTESSQTEPVMAESGRSPLLSLKEEISASFLVIFEGSFLIPSITFSSSSR